MIANRRLTIVLANLALYLSIANSANAGWQYAKWGMKVDQVIAASKGTARRFKGSNSLQSNTDFNPLQDEGASGSFESGDLKFTVGFFSRRIVGGWRPLLWNC
jgi:hypothetical protein